MCVVSRTVASAFFKPTTCGEVGGHVSWSRHCFNRSLSHVSELSADFMVACTAAAREKEVRFNCEPFQKSFQSNADPVTVDPVCHTTLLIKWNKCEILIISDHSTSHSLLFYVIFICTGAWKATLLMALTVLTHRFIRVLHFIILNVHAFANLNASRINSSSPEQL